MLHIHEWHSDGTGEGQCDCDGRWFKNKRLYDLHLADAVIRELGLEPERRVGPGEPGEGLSGFIRYVTEWETEP